MWQKIGIRLSYLLLGAALMHGAWWYWWNSTGSQDVADLYDQAWTEGCANGWDQAKSYMRPKDIYSFNDATDEQRLKGDWPRQEVLSE